MSAVPTVCSQHCWLNSRFDSFPVYPYFLDGHEPDRDVPVRHNAAAMVSILLDGFILFKKRLDFCFI
jgi:hypothetical protein